ncbi:hypothetical protein D1871_19040 [Nakamurella silvestris]|nr:hypothetical protein D1871_19040 [Nakamurella silvestris]
MTGSEPMPGWAEEELDRALRDLHPPAGDDAEVLARVRAEMMTALATSESAADQPGAPADSGWGSTPVTDLRSAPLDAPVSSRRPRRWVPAVAAAACVVAVAVTTILVVRAKPDDGVTAPVLPPEVSATAVPSDTRAPDTDAPKSTAPEPPSITTAAGNPAVPETGAVTAIHGASEPAEPPMPEFAGWASQGTSMEAQTTGRLTIKDGCVVLEDKGRYTLPIFPVERTKGAVAGLDYNGYDGWVGQVVVLAGGSWTEGDPTPSGAVPTVPDNCGAYPEAFLVGAMGFYTEPYRTELEGKTFTLVEIYSDTAPRSDAPSERGLEFRITFAADSATAETLRDGKSCGKLIYPTIVVQPGLETSFGGLKLGEPEGKWCPLGKELTGPPSGNLTYDLGNGQLKLGQGPSGWILKEQ